MARNTKSDFTNRVHVSQYAAGGNKDMIEHCGHALPLHVKTCSSSLYCTMIASSPAPSRPRVTAPLPGLLCTLLCVWPVRGSAHRMATVAPVSTPGAGGRSSKPSSAWATVEIEDEWASTRADILVTKGREGEVAPTEDGVGRHSHIHAFIPVVTLQSDSTAQPTPSPPCTPQLRGWSVTGFADDWGIRCAPGCTPCRDGRCLYDKARWWMGKQTAACCGGKYFIRIPRCFFKNRKTIKNYKT